ncbi:phosphocholine-specific phospholipase C [Algoriphagus machipongonensis]|uniref:phospholipase C n=1 Tax=Algoriphagus machipongonensis TaxID=388413 RepID=A3HWF0_9BACT|nr:phospholipase C, phosphocholine-specific [Algoriphagus machipongonensis]EAZ80923.1 phospholipase C, phosphocholine-specific [Algoriphagus machipongonensis]
MNNSRREFLKKTALLSGAAGLWQVLPSSIEKALAISPDPGTTFEDAEHVVMLMQENRSFDHCFGTLRGVRGYNDPRAITIPGNLPVWMQADKKGTHFPPFRLDINATKATWMRDIPHSWENQVDARNRGKYNDWIESKRPGREEFREVPLTMGYYTREDIPFYYAMADAFTVFDQHFCAALTGTTTNRSYFWTGKTHGEPGDKAKVRNGEVNYSNEAKWKTFPERLEQSGIPWRVYQNEINLSSLVEDHSLLANFSDNNLEWFSQYHVFFSPGYYEFLEKQKSSLESELAEFDRNGAPANSGPGYLKEIEKKKDDLAKVEEHLEKFSPANFDKLSEFEKSIHQKAFARNTDDPNFHQVEKITYTEDGEERTVSVPKGDILHQFRKDVNNGTLPAVSWLVAPQKFSDHPSAPWYGAWYVSEVLDILTKDPEVWKKTIFIINYDENDGYFDHQPPFVVPDPKNSAEGLISEGINTEGEYVYEEEERKAGFKEHECRTSPVGLGYRVPLIVASPWSRGGYVNSQVSDITSTIQFLETFLSKKSGKQIKENNISGWRRMISGDLTSAFRPYNGEPLEKLKPVNRNEFMTQIHKAQFKGLPDNFMAIPRSEAKKWDTNRLKQEGTLPSQEPGSRPSNALNYDLRVLGKLNSAKNAFEISFEASKELFGDDTWGAPFQVYAPGKYKSSDSENWEEARVWQFAVKAGDRLEYTWPISDFEGNEYHLRVYGPNGFYREFKGKPTSAILEANMQPVKMGGSISRTAHLKLTSHLAPYSIQILENNYRKGNYSLSLSTGKPIIKELDFEASHGWYDFTVKADGLEWTFAGRMENGEESISDPLLS